VTAPGSNDAAGRGPSGGRREALPQPAQSHRPAGPAQPARPPRPAAIAGLLGIALTLSAGTLLRCWNLRDQVLGGDELHAVRAALSQPLPALLTTYQLADSCIPLTALDRLLLDHGLALDEWRLRLPVLASGLAALAALPLLARRRLPPAGPPLFCVLLAVSPLLILYSRIARSYMPATLFAFAAAMAFDRWWAPGGAGGGGESRWAAAYVACAALAAWFHLGTAPIVIAPLLYAAGELALGSLARRGGAAGAAGPGPDRRPWPPRRPAALAAVALGLAACCALFLVPAWPSLVRLVAAKRLPQEVPTATWWGVLRLQAGVRAGQALPALLFWAAALYGAGALLRRRPRFGGYLLALVVAQLLGILLLSPLGLARLQVLDRYLLPALPVVLLWVASGLAHAWWPRQGRLGSAGQRVAAAGLVLTWLAVGPFADAEFRSSSFMHHNDLVAFALPHATVPPGGPPRPYLALGGPPGAAVVELPWPPVWDFGRSFYVYQETHGLRVLVAAPAGTLPARRLRLRNRVSPEPAALLGSGARWVAVHRHLAAEEERLGLPPGALPPRRMPPPLAAQLAAAGESMAARLAADWGPPAFADADVAVWDLRLARSGLRRARPSRPGPAAVGTSYGEASRRGSLTAAENGRPPAPRSP
jgi:hypothetical protein